MADLLNGVLMLTPNRSMRAADGCAPNGNVVRPDGSLLSSVTRFSNSALQIAAVGVLATMIAGNAPLGSSTAHAQVAGDTLFGEAKRNPDAQMLLEADELIYDESNNSVAAAGNVQIAYDGYTLSAARVTYDRTSGRVLASGDVEILEPNGNRVFAQEIDITDDFQDGFVAALRVETPQNTRFAAESAERRDGEIAVFNNGVYTACEVCKENPDKPPFWQIRANRVIVNNKTKTISYEDASFEVFGKPIAYMPRFSHADPSIKRKSGFLLVPPGASDELGYYGGLSYFWNLAPNYDLTLTGRYFSRQGFLGEAEWRHRTANGEYNLRFAKISQEDPGAFKGGHIDRSVTDRSAVMSKGKFNINSRWSWGWNVLAQSDGNFARTYNLPGFSSKEITNQIWLTGLNDKNYFDLRAQKFLIQNSEKDQVTIRDVDAVGNTNIYPKDELRQEQQAKVLPSFDYNLVSSDKVAGGQVSFDMNVTRVKRNLVDIANYDIAKGLSAPDERYHGIPGEYSRASVETEWKASNIVNGAMVTASLSGRADAIMLDTEDLNTKFNPLMSNDDIYRAMPAAMLEIRYPLIASNGMTSQIFEPIAQVIVRPNETHIGEFPNEDAQSMVFDTTNLFERDKFSGFDRVEGGSRANVGFRYSASFANGASVNIAAGQSFHLHGKNSFAERGIVNAGIESGLETDKSDYVASMDVNTGKGLSLGLSGRFDEKTAEIRRGEVGARYFTPNFAASASYIFIDKQPNYAFSRDRQEVRGSASVKLAEYFRLFGNAAYDIENGEMFSRGVGIAYDDSCTSLSVAYRETDNRYNGDSVERSINFTLGLRTIGQTEFNRKLYDASEEDVNN